MLIQYPFLFNENYGHCIRTRSIVLFPAIKLVNISCGLLISLGVFEGLEHFQDWGQKQQG